MHASLQSLGSALTYGMGATDQDRLALAYSLTSAQNAARMVSADPTSLQYFDAMSAGMVAVGWVQWWSTQVDNAALVATDVDAGATLDWRSGNWSLTSMASARAIQQSWQSLGTAVAASHEAQALLDAWWPCTEVAASVRHMRIGPLVDIAGTPALALAVINIRGTLDSWRQLFQPDADVQYAGRAVGMTLDAAAYASHAPALEASLEDQVESNIRHARIDLD